MKTPKLLPHLPEIDALRKSGLSVQAIANHFGVKRSMMYCAVNRIGVYSSESKNYGRLIPESLMAKIDQLCERYPYTTIAEHLGISATIISRAHRRVGPYEGSPV